jgi:hypothetical protein
MRSSAVNSRACGSCPRTTSYNKEGGKHRKRDQHVSKENLKLLMEGKLAWEEVKKMIRLSPKDADRFWKYLEVGFRNLTDRAIREVVSSVIDFDTGGLAHVAITGTNAAGAAAEKGEHKHYHSTMRDSNPWEIFKGGVK